MARRLLRVREAVRAALEISTPRDVDSTAFLGFSVLFAILTRVSSLQSVAASQRASYIECRALVYQSDRQRRPEMAVDAIPPGGKVLQTVSGHSNAFMQITDTQIWKARPTRAVYPGRLGPAPAHFPHPPRPYPCTRRSVCVAQLTDAPERDMLVTLMDCPELKELVPTYTREVPLEKFIGREPGKDAVVVELQDVTSGFGKDPCIMDIKLGTRTFLEDEVDNPKVRGDPCKTLTLIRTHPNPNPNPNPDPDPDPDPNPS